MDKIRTGQFNLDVPNNQITFLDTRFYTDEQGNYFPSVTTYLEAYPKTASFFKWLKENGEDADQIRDDAGDEGSMVHQLTERYDKGETVTYLDADGSIRYKSIEWAMFERYVEFTKEVKPEIVRTEYNIVSPELQTGGTIDRDIILNTPKVKGKFIMDIKTSNAIHDHFWGQLAAYEKLHRFAFPDEQIDGVCILWLKAKTRGASKQGAIQGRNWQLIFPPESLDHYWKVFQATQLLWNEVNSSTKPRNVSYTLEHKK